MAYIDRIKPEDYSAIVAAFGQVGAPVFARVALLINAQRKAAGNPKSIAFTTLKKAWDKGWESQIGGAPAPAIKTLFPSWAVKPPAPSEAAPVSEPEPSPEPMNSNPPAARAGAASVGGHDAAGQAPNAVSHSHDPKGMTNEVSIAMVAPTSAEALDPIRRVLTTVEHARANALLSEMSILQGARVNLRGLEEIASTVITTLAGRKDILQRLVGDLAHSDAVTLRTVRETIRELGQFMKDTAATFKLVQESQRLLVGMPQRIEERRGVGGGRGEDENDARAISRLASLLRTRVNTGERYDGEETGDEVQDAEFTEPGAPAAPTENAIASGEEKAKEPEPAA